MRKADLINQVAEQLALTKKDTERVTDALLEAIGQALAAGDRVQLTNFGTFETRRRAARMCMSIHSGEKIEVEEAVLPVFRPSPQLRERVNHR